MATKKGINEVIALIIIVMITIASAASMFFWLTRIQQSGQGATEQSQSILLERVFACAKIRSFTFNPVDNTSAMEIQNCGNTKLTVGDSDDAVLLSNDGGGCSFNLDCSFINDATCPVELGRGTLSSITLDLGSATCSGTTDTAATVLREGERHEITLTVDRKARAAATFIPTRLITCGVSLSSPPDQSAGVCDVRCYDYTITSTANTAETFDLSTVEMVGSSVADCSGAGPLSTPPGTCPTFPFPAQFHSGFSCPGTSHITQVTVPAGGNSTFSVHQHGLHPTALPCTVTVTAKGDQITSCLATDTFTTS